MMTDKKRERFEHKVDFESLVETIKVRLKSFKSEDESFFVCDRLNDNTGFLSVYKDSLFHYIDGIILCERLYFKKAITFEDRNMVRPSEESVKLYDEFLKFAEDLETNKNVNQKDVADKLQEYTDKLSNESPPSEVVKLPYYVLPFGQQNKVLLRSLKDIDDETIDILSKVMGDYILSFFRTMFLVSDQEYGVMLRGIEYGDFVDIVAIIIKEQV